MNIGIKLKKIRLDKNLTQSAFAKLIGKSLATVRKYENGDRTPPIDMLNKIAEALGVSVSRLLESEEESFSYKLLLAIENALREKEVHGVDVVLRNVEHRLHEYEMDPEPLYELSKNKYLELSSGFQTKLMEYLFELDYKLCANFCEENKTYLYEHKELLEFYSKSLVLQMDEIEDTSLDLLRKYLIVVYGNDIIDIINEDMLKELHVEVNEFLEYALYKIEKKYHDEDSEDED